MMDLTAQYIEQYYEERKGIYTCKICGIRIKKGSSFDWQWVDHIREHVVEKMAKAMVRERGYE